MEANDGTQELWIRKIRSRIYPDRYSLAISFITKLNLRLIYTKLVAFLSLTECSYLRHSSSIVIFFCT